MTKLQLALFCLISALLMTSCAPLPSTRAGTNTKTNTIDFVSQPSPPRKTVYDLCRAYGGTYANQHRECDAMNACQNGQAGINQAGINQAGGHQSCMNNFANECRARGGFFNPCASACRNSPGARACIQVCVPTCKH